MTRYCVTVMRPGGAVRHVIAADSMDAVLDRLQRAYPGGGLTISDLDKLDPDQEGARQ